jgi:uncharacterized protein (TIGR03067 family)
MHIGLAFAIAGLMLAVEPGKQETPKDESVRLEGKWVVVSFSDAGKDDPDARGGKVIITSDRLTFVDKDGKEVAFKYRIDATKKPKTIDQSPANKETFTTLGIYEVIGDTARLCVAENAKGEAARPSEFKEGKGQILVVLKREK